MKYKWKYFISLNQDDRLNNLVEEYFSDDGLLICCDPAVAKKFNFLTETG